LATTASLAVTIADPSSTFVVAATLLPAALAPAWSTEDFSLSAIEQQLIERPAGYQPSAPMAELRPDCAVLSCVALTFDDGPSPHTPALLEALASHGVSATFFVVGKSVRAMPAELIAIQAAGHEIALHSDQHSRMPTLSSAAIARDFERSRQTLRELAGIEPELYRPPYGLHSQRVGKLANAAVIMWDVDPQDWRVRSSRPIAQRVLSRVKPGSIVVLHELEQTVAALDSLVTELLARGYTLVTVSEILGEAPIHSKIYRSGLAAQELRAAG
jgi:peptidoglycan/xylan/chitin deacetylase (PgdA/CDA1 family)